MTNIEQVASARVRHSSFVIRHSSFSGRHAFTLIELLVVIAIIIVLAGLVLSTVGYVQKKGARSRAETEIAAMSAACESYKADNGIYPSNGDTNGLNPSSPDPTVYAAASLYLYEELSGDHNADRTVNASDDLTGNGVVPKTYFAFKPNMLLPAPPSTAAVTAIRDPFGNSYGYSTAKASGAAFGNNPTFDLWSTANSPDPNQWIKNW